jgi:hypothetical protein
MLHRETRPATPTTSVARARAATWARVLCWPALGVTAAVTVGFVAVGEGCSSTPAEERTAAQGAPIIPPGPCDMVPGMCSAAYSMTRAMTQNWNGPLFQVSRDSDGTATDVQQNATGTANWAPLVGQEGFCTTHGTGPEVHCYVTRLYDQSGNGNDLSTYKGGGHKTWGIDCSDAHLPLFTCAPPFTISAKYGLPVLFTPFSTGLVSCADSQSGCTRNVPAGNVPKAVFVFQDDRQASACCGSNGIEEPTSLGTPWYSMFAPIMAFGIGSTFTGNDPYKCSDPTEYCAGADMEQTATQGFSFGTAAQDVMIEARNDGVGDVAAEVNGAFGATYDVPPDAMVWPATTEIRAGFAGDATPVQEAVYEFAILSGVPTPGSTGQDQALRGNVSSFYNQATMAPSAACRGPADLAFLDSNTNGAQGDGGLVAANALYSRMFGGWGLRQLSASYTGPLVALQREDLAVASFGTSGCGLDPTAQTWCAGHTCSVTQLYCQAFVQGAKASTWSAANDTHQCPSLVPPSGQAPTLVFDGNGVPAIHFDGTQQLCNLAANTMQNAWSVSAVARRTGALTTASAVVTMRGALDTQPTLGFGAAANTASWSLVGLTLTTPAAGDTQWHSLIGANDYGASQLTVDGVVVGSGSDINVPGGGDLCVGAPGITSSRFIGDLREVTLSYDMTGTTGAGDKPLPSAYSDVNAGNALFNNQQQAWGTMRLLPIAPQIGGAAAGMSGGGGPVVAAMGANDSLVFYTATSSGWSPTTLGGPNTAYSAPAVAVRSSGEIDVAVMGPDNSLSYYLLLPGSSTWLSTQVAGPLSTYSAPAMVVRSTGEADIAVQGPDNSLSYYVAWPGTAWFSGTIAGPLSTYSAPAMSVRSSGEADVVTQGPSGSILYYTAVPSGPWGATQLGGAGATASAPSLAVRPSGEADVVVQRPDNALIYYYQLTSGGPWSSGTIPTAATIQSAPAVLVRQLPNSSTVEADVVAQGPGNTLVYSWATPGSAWSSVTVNQPPSFSPPALVARPTGEIDLVVVSTNQSLAYAWATPGSPWSTGTIAPAGTTF